MAHSGSRKREKGGFKILKRPSSLEATGRGTGACEHLSYARKNVVLGAEDRPVEPTPLMIALEKKNCETRAEKGKLSQSTSAKGVQTWWTHCNKKCSAKIANEIERKVFAIVQHSVTNKSNSMYKAAPTDNRDMKNEEEQERRLQKLEEKFNKFNAKERFNNLEKITNKQNETIRLHNVALKSAF